MNWFGSSGDSPLTRTDTESMRLRIADAIRAILEGTARTAGDQFFSAFANELAGSLNVPYAFVGECIDESRTLVRTLAFWQRGTLAASAVYHLTEDTCDLTISDAQSYLGTHLLGTAGEVIGLVAVLDDKPMASNAIWRPVLDACAHVASRELERFRMLNRIATLNDEITRLKSAGYQDGGYVAATPLSSTLEDIERTHILATLAQTGWVIEGPRGAAKILDMHPNTLRSRMKRLGVERARHAIPPIEGV